MYTGGKLLLLLIVGNLVEEDNARHHRIIGRLQSNLLCENLYVTAYFN
jgi:hypothetical protein